MISWKWNLCALWVANVLTATGMWAMVPFLTYFVEELGVEDPARRNLWTGILVAAAPVAAALMGPVWGGIGDRYSRKAMVLRALGAIALFVGLMSFARSTWTLLVLRLLQGLFSGYTPPAIALVSVQAPAGRQGTVSAVMQSAVHGGAILGYVLGGHIAEGGAMRAVFPICAVLAVVSLIVVLVLVREEPRPVRESRTTLRGLVRDMADDFRYVLGLRALIRLLVAVILVRVLTSSVNPNYARYVEMVGGGRRDVGDLFSVQAICLFASVPLWGRISEVVGPRRVFAWSALLLGLALLGQSRVEGLGGLFVWRALDGVAQGGILPAAYAMALRESAVDRRGSAVGVVFLALALSHAIGAGLGGPLLNILGFKALLATVGATTLAVAVGVAWESRRQRRGGPGPPSPPGPAHGTTTDAGADPSVAHEACPSRRSGDTAPAG